MKFYQHIINNSITVFFQRNSKYDFLLMIYYSLLFTSAFCIGSILLVVSSIRHFFLAFELFWLLVITTTAIVSSEHFYGIIKNAVRLCVAVILGATLSYISFSMVGRSVWPNVFIFFVILLLGTGPMMTSKLCPFYLFKFVFLTYYYLTFEDTFRKEFYSPIDELLFTLGSAASFGSCLLTCLLLRAPFANILFIQSSNVIIKRSISYIKELKKQTNFVFSSNNNFKIYYKDIDENSKTDDFIKKLEIQFHDYSDRLNHLDQMLSDSKKEFWAKHYIQHYERIQILFERNLKKLITIGFEVNGEINDKIRFEIEPIIPQVNKLFDEILYIFKQMGHQLKYKFIHTKNDEQYQWFQNSIASKYYNDLDKKDEDDHTFYYNHLNFIYDVNDFKDIKENSLEWNQLQINKSFERINEIIGNIDTLFETIFKDAPLFNPNVDNSLSKVYILLKCLNSFCSEQKLLSKEIFLVAYHNSLNRNRPQEYLAIVATIKRFFNYITTHKQRKQKRLELERKRNEEFPDHTRIKIKMKEKLKIYFTHLLKDRLLYNWQFTIKYSLVSAGGAVAIYEIKKHTQFQLFEMLNWMLNAYIVTAGPDVGAMGALTFVRVIVLIIGGFLGYACVVISELGGNDSSKALIYIGFSFSVIFLFGVVLNFQMFKGMITNIVFTFSVVSIPLYESGSNIIFTLYRIGYVVLGFILVFLLSMVVPYYDYRELEKNLFKIPFLIIELVDYLFYYSFEPLHQSNKTLLSIPYNQTNENYVFNKIDYNNFSHVNNINSEHSFKIAEKITIDQYKSIFSEKYINLRRIFPSQRNLLLDSNFELLFKRGKFYEIENILLSIQHFHDLFGALEFVFVESFETHIRTIGKESRNQVRELFDDMELSSTLLCHFQVEKDNLGRVIRDSSLPFLTHKRDNGIDLMNKVVLRVNSLVSNYNIPTLEKHQLNATLFVLFNFVKQYHLIFKKLMDRKDLMVKNSRVSTLNNNNYKISSNLVDVKENILNILK
ncbi:hypothetical protein RB653_010177 [Dictyostelium firmibasis]|uniref:Uncharacterized protein n=1 Tax=Dictyostelium firmibasis TaxID=79012 RepID=A0AAN7U0N9_9MYCE